MTQCSSSLFRKTFLPFIRSNLIGPSVEFLAWMDADWWICISQIQQCTLGVQTIQGGCIVARIPCIEYSHLSPKQTQQQQLYWCFHRLGQNCLTASRNVFVSHQQGGVSWKQTRRCKTISFWNKWTKKLLYAENRRQCYWILGKWCQLLYYFWYLPHPDVVMFPQLQLRCWFGFYDIKVMSFWNRVLAVFDRLSLEQIVNKVL